MRDHPLTHRVMWRMDLVYKLYSIALLFVENGRVPDFSLAPGYDGIGYVTPREVPNIVNKGKYFVGGCEFVEQVSSGNWLSGGSTPQSPGFGYQEALSSHNQTASSGNWLADMGGGGSNEITPPEVITGYTYHGLHQVIGRDGGYGVSPSAILDAFRHGEPQWQERRETWKYMYDDVKLVLNTSGKVVTAMSDHNESKYRGV